MIQSNVPNNTLINRAKVELYDGSTLIANCTCSDRLTGFDIQRVGEVGKFFGFGVIHKLNLQLIDLDRNLQVIKGNTVQVALGDINNNFDYPYPTFIVSDVTRDENNNSISVVAYDKLYESTLHTIKELNIDAPYTIESFVRACTNLIGINSLSIDTNANNSFQRVYSEGANFDLDEGGNFSGDETIRQLLTYVAEATQTIYFMDSANSLKFYRLTRDSEPEYNMSKDEYFTLETGPQAVLTGICNVTELGDNVLVGNETGIVQYIRENPFYNNRPDISVLLNDALANVNGLVSTPFVAQDWNGNHRLEFGDKISIELEDGSIVQSFIVDDVISFDGVLAESTQWYVPSSEELDSKPATISEVINQTFARVDKVNKNIQLLTTETETKIEDLTETVNTKVSEINITLDGINQKVTNVETVNNEQATKIGELEVKDNEITAKVSSVESKADGNTTAISALQINTNSISASVSSLQSNTQSQIESLDNSIEAIHQEASLKMTSDQVNIAIESALDGGVDKVVTSLKNYRFDDQGLNISSSDSVVNTTITEDGMTIEKQGVDVLTATNTGVKALKLHSDEFLEIGNNTYFSDWKGNRVGCFWNN